RTPPAAAPARRGASASAPARRARRAPTDCSPCAASPPMPPDLASSYYPLPNSQCQLYREPGRAGGIHRGLPGMRHAILRDRPFPVAPPSRPSGRFSLADHVPRRSVCVLSFPVSVPGSGTAGTGSTFGSVVDIVIAANVAGVDCGVTYPRVGIEALGKSGLLALSSAPEVGGPGAGLGAAAHVVERLAGVCGSTAMVVLMHYAATSVIEAHGPEDLRRAIAGGGHLTTLAFSEAGSRSHFWAPVGTATAEGGMVRLRAQKSWVTAAG